MNKFILAITGPAGAGKSTVSQNLAKQIEQCVNIDADYIKHFIVNGFIYDDTPAGNEQWALLGKNIGIVAHNFQEAGFNIIINGYINEPAWNEIEKAVTITFKVLLLPNLDVVTERDASRTADYVMGEEAVKVHHNYFSTSTHYDEYLKLDSTKHTVDETVEAILDLLSKDES